MTPNELQLPQDESATDGARAPERPPRTPNLGRTTMVGMAWLIAQAVGSIAIRFGTQIVLAKILLPASFGELALAGTVTTIATVLTSFGVDDVLLQRLKTMRFWATPAFWMSLAFGMLGMVIVWCGAPLAAWIYKAPRLIPVLFITSLSMPLGALSTVPMVLMRSKLQFRFIALWYTGELIVTQLMTIILALNGLGIFSFVIPGPIVVFVRSIAMWIMTKPKLGKMKFRQLGHMGTRGSAILGQRLINAGINQGDYFVLGLTASKSVVGAYYFAYKLAVQPVQMLAGNLTNVLFPALIQLADDPIRQRDAAIDASRVLAFVAMPYCFMQAAIAPYLLHFAFGDKWKAAMPLMQILSIGLAFDTVAWIAGSLLTATGEFKRSFIYQCFLAPFFFTFATIGAFLYSATGVAIGVSLFYMILTPVFSFAVFSYRGSSLKQIISIYAVPAAIAAICMGGAVLISSVLPANDIVRSVAIVVTGGFSYLGLTRLFAPVIFAKIVDRLTLTLRSKQRSVA